VRIDTIGAIFIAGNTSSGFCTGHIEIRYYFIHEHVEDRFIKIIFVRPNENDADILLRTWRRKLMRSTLWSSLESGDVFEWFVIGRVLERISYIQWVVSNTPEITF
jgi:hypothetical protein